MFHFLYHHTCPTALFFTLPRVAFRLRVAGEDFAVLLDGGDVLTANGLDHLHDLQERTKIRFNLDPPKIGSPRN